MYWVDRTVVEKYSEYDFDDCMVSLDTVLERSGLISTLMCLQSIHHIEPYLRSLCLRFSYTVLHLMDTDLLALWNILARSTIRRPYDQSYVDIEKQLCSMVDTSQQVDLTDTLSAKVLLQNCMYRMVHNIVTAQPAKVVQEVYGALSYSTLIKSKTGGKITATDLILAFRCKEETELKLTTILHKFLHKSPPILS